MKTYDLDLRDVGLYNAFINGNFDFWQRGTSLARTQANTQGAYLADRVSSGTGGATTKSMTVSRSTSVPTTPLFQSLYSYEVLNNTAVASFGTSEFLQPFIARIEGTIFQPLYGKDFTVGFWLFTNFSGNFPVVVRNGGTPSFFSYATNISVSSGWQYCCVNIPWNANITSLDTTAAIGIDLGFAGGTTLQAPSLNSWLSGTYYTTSTATNWAATAGNLFRISQLQVRSGQWSAFEMQNNFQRTGIDQARELHLCQRYYEVISSGQGVLGLNPLTTNATVAIPIQWKATKRAAPTVTIATGASQQAGIDGATVFQTNVGVGVFYNPSPVTADADY